jgi:hypothetical protein
MAEVVLASIAQRIRQDLAQTLRKLAEAAEQTPEGRVADMVGRLRVDLRRALVVVREMNRN